MLAVSASGTRRCYLIVAMVTMQVFGWSIFKWKNRTSYMSLLFKEKKDGQQLEKWESASKFCNVRLMSLLVFVRLVRAATAHLLVGVQNRWCPG